MNRSYSKIRHMMESNIRLEKRLLTEQAATNPTSSNDKAIALEALDNLSKNNLAYKTKFKPGYLNIIGGVEKVINSSNSVGTHAVRMTQYLVSDKPVNYSNVDVLISASGDNAAKDLTADDLIGLINNGGATVDKIRTTEAPFDASAAYIYMTSITRGKLTPENALVLIKSVNPNITDSLYNGITELWQASTSTADKDYYKQLSTIIRPQAAPATPATPATGTQIAQK
jgi:hypothetical protein